MDNKFKIINFSLTSNMIIIIVYSKNEKIMEFFSYYT